MDDGTIINTNFFPLSPLFRSTNPPPDHKTLKALRPASLDNELNLSYSTVAYHLPSMRRSCPPDSAFVRNINSLAKDVATTKIPRAEYVLSGVR